MTLPVLLWVFVILYYSVNLPWYDDFDPFPDFLRKWITDSSFSDRLTLLFQPNNEHRMVIGKLVTLTYYWVTGHLNFTFLHIAGACFTLGTFRIFWLSFAKTKINWWYFLPVPFLLFQLQYHLVFLWAICSLQHQPVVFFISLSMFLLSRNRFGWAVLAAVCATYAMSNGIFVWPAGVMILLLRSQYKQLSIWLLAGALAVGFYFYGMSAQGNESSMEFFAKYPHLSVLGFFAFLGGLFDFFPEKTIVVRSALPVLMGFLVMIWVVIWLYKQLIPWLTRTFNWPKNTRYAGPEASVDKKNQDMFLLGILTFLLVNALIIGLLRPRFGFFVMIVSNYKMYPALFLTVAYLTFINAVSGKQIQEWIFQFALTTSVIIWVFSIYGYLPVIAERNKYLTVNGYNQEHNAFGLGHVPFSTSAFYVDRMMKQMVSWGAYEYPDKPENLAKEIGKIQNPISVEEGITVTMRDSILVVNDPQSSMSLNRSNGHYAFVRDDKQLYFFKMTPQKYAGRNILKQYDKGADTEIPMTSLKPGSYDLGIINIENGKSEGGILRKITIP
ncbi:hypothetical protein [Dyadobacter fanqingshengii]|uniref:Uncharacterized protein n=1 Tax=Dyadobacter fanqingshengii TaxID=2906443 RepID=A0A9X1P6Z5_9BACT|nr:hypothetical protein [Dyadobacter fanqingshengii]MCF0039175.1 hypothetical protein [Dyadobacter fanqingshengii]USJ34006.1 hypothetical protein NFI81_14950 [Dyadobacter fanqingshengii]